MPEAWPPAILSGTLANRPAPGVPQRYYWATDVQMLYRDNGTIWEPIGHGNLGGVAFGQHHEHFHRYLLNSMPFLAGTAARVIALGATILGPVDVPFLCTIDQLGYRVGDVQAGNVRLGLYPTGATVDLPDGADVVVETGSVPQTIVSEWQLETVADTQITPGQYFVGVQADDVTATFYICNFARLQPAGFVMGRTFAQAYGAFTSPCPVTGAYDTYRSPIVLLRVASVP